MVSLQKHSCPSSARLDTVHRTVSDRDLTYVVIETVYTLLSATMWSAANGFTLKTRIDTVWLVNSLPKSLKGPASEHGQNNLVESRHTRSDDSVLLIQSPAQEPQ